jgi:hypothetical protein
VTELIEHHFIVFAVFDPEEPGRISWTVDLENSFHRDPIYDPSEGGGEQGWRCIESDEEQTANDLAAEHLERILRRASQEPLH